MRLVQKLMLRVHWIVQVHHMTPTQVHQSRARMALSLVRISLDIVQVHLC